MGEGRDWSVVFVDLRYHAVLNKCPSNKTKYFRKKGSTRTASTVYLEGLPTSKTSTFECFFRLSAPFSCSEIDKLLISSRDGCGNL